MSDQDKKRKLMLILMPIAALGMLAFMIYVIFFSGKKSTDGNDSNLAQQEYNVDIEETSKTEQKSKLELYREKRENSREKSKNKVSSSDFYSLEGETEENFTEDSIQDYSHLPPSKRPKSKTNDYDITPEDQAPPVKSTPITPQKKESQKIIIKEKIVYVDKTPTPPAQNTPVQPQEPQKTRSRGSALGSLTYGETGTGQTPTGIVYCYIDNDNKKVSSGDDVRLVISDNSQINGFQVPAGTKVVGKATMSSDRVLITINQILINGNYTQVNYKVYEVDGTVGIKVAIDEKQQIKDEVSRNATSGPGKRIEIPLVGDISTAPIQRSRNSRSAILVDRHRVFLK